MKRMLGIGIGLALGIAALPFLIGLIGLAVDSAYLSAYHWYAYYSIPAGIIVLLATIVAALVKWLSSRGS